eukprot:Skav201372  [mRNA]  locus=scaffold176:429048:431061:- [translate_table: standard]
MELAPVLRCGSSQALHSRLDSRPKPRWHASQLAFALPCGAVAVASGASRTAQRVAAKGVATVAQSDELEQLQLLQRSSAALQKLQQQWMEIELADLSKAEELMQREAELQRSLKDVLRYAALLSWSESFVNDFPYGDPADTWTPVDCDHPVVSAHSDVTRAMIQTELGKLHWMLKCAEALGHEDLRLGEIWEFGFYHFSLMARILLTQTQLGCMFHFPFQAEQPAPRKSEQGNVADLLLKMAELRLRLFDVCESYQLLQRAGPLVGKQSRQHAVWRALLDNCLMCECLKTTPSMGLEIDGNAADLLRDFGKLLVDSNYNSDRILQLTGAESLVDFSNDEQLYEFSQRLANEESASNESTSLVYLVRLFLLRSQEPLEDALRILGSECCQLLLRLQAITALREDGSVLSAEEAASAASESQGEIRCFSNIRLWPSQSLIIATDAQTWPYGQGDQRFEPVMYLSDDSLALIDASPEVEGLHILDMCCGSGVQGISALARKAASVTFSDANPRALRFVRFNLAMNNLSESACRFCLGDAYSALDCDESQFDGILANPPFLPNPDGIASQAIALYGNGGAFGEDVLSSIVEGCPQWLVPGGWLLMVTYAPNVEQMTKRIQRLLVWGGPISNVPGIMVMMTMLRHVTFLFK